MCKFSQDNFNIILYTHNIVYVRSYSRSQVIIVVRSYNMYVQEHIRGYKGDYMLLVCMLFRLACMMTAVRHMVHMLYHANRSWWGVPVSVIRTPQLSGHLNSQDTLIVRTTTPP